MSDGVTTKILVRVASIINNMVKTYAGGKQLKYGSNVANYDATVTENYTLRFASKDNRAIGCSLHIGDCDDTVASLMLLLNFTMKILEFCHETTYDDGTDAQPDAEERAQQHHHRLNEIQADVASWKQTKICS